MPADVCVALKLWAFVDTYIFVGCFAVPGHKTAAMAQPWSLEALLLRLHVVRAPRVPWVDSALFLEKEIAPSLHSLSW